MKTHLPNRMITSAGLTNRGPLSFDGVDYNDPRTLLERAEEAAGGDPSGASMASFVAAQGRQLAWLLEGSTIEAIGMRVLVSTLHTRPDLLPSELRSLKSIAALRGEGKSSAHKLAKSFEATFGVRPALGKTDSAKRSYSAAWRRTHTPSR